MCDSVTAWQRCRRAGKPALLVALAIVLAGCAAADAPLPFITTPDPETTATTPPANETPAAGTGAPAQGNAAAHSGASNAASTGATTPATANSSPAAPHATAPHSPVRQDLPFPSFSTPATAGERKVMTDAEKAKMESDLEGLAKSRENKMRQEIEQAQ